MLNLIAYAVILFLSVSVVMLGYFIRKNNKKEKLLKAKQELFLEEKEDKKGLKSLSEGFKKKNKRRYNRLQLYLSRTGANYMFGRVIDPVEFILFKILAAVMLGITGFILGGYIGGSAGVIAGYILPNIILGMANDRDNDLFLADIRGVYETLKIKTESGMFLTTSIRQCYKVVENKRLKKALLELSGELGTTGNVKDAVDLFQMKFKNRYIDQLCVTLRQSFDSGSTLNTITDMANNLSDIQKAIELDAKNKLEKEVMFTQLMILAAIMVMILCVIMLKMGEITSAM